MSTGANLGEKQIVRVFEECGALREGHFVYTSGRHGRKYVNKARVIAWPRKLKPLCRMIAEHFAGQGIEVVAVPAVGGVALGQWVADFLSSDEREVSTVYAEKEGDILVFKREYDLFLPGRKVLTLDDIVTTGGSMRKLNAAVRINSGNIVGSAVLWNRGGVEFETPTLSLVSSVQFESWAPDDCQLCKDHVPFTAGLGHAGDKK